MKKNIVIISLVVLSVLIASFVVIRNQKTEKEISIDPNFTSYKNKLTRTFPDFPVYQGAKISESRKETGAIDKQKGFSAVWTTETDKTAIEIGNWYKQELQKKGWLIEENPEKYPFEVIMEAKKENLYAIVHIEKENPKETEILVQFPLTEI